MQVQLMQFYANSYVSGGILHTKKIFSKFQNLRND